VNEQGLLDAIWEQPHDDSVRLVYADWLEESGGDANLARAELIRVQIDLARLPGARALAESPHLERLQDLGVYCNPLTRSQKAVSLLRQRFGKRVEGLPGR
jgi:uncharacterized protein (TIGR02996 family)